jgi:hypothetical protein
MNIKSVFALTLAGAAAIASAQNPTPIPTEAALPDKTSKSYLELYGDAISQRLSGQSSSIQVRSGMRQGDLDYHIYVKNEAYNTRGSNLPFQYAARGTSAGVGVRQWFPGNKAFALASYGIGLSGANQRKGDLRVGMAGYDEWSSEKWDTDVYSDVFYVQLAQDVYGSIRFRPGYILNRTAEGKLWGYSIFQAWMTGKGTNGVENRAETGLGLGYVFSGKVSVNAELRYGYSFRGSITNRSYFNPLIMVSGFFN